jgi:hypothetical protein
MKGLVTEGCAYEVENVLVTHNDPKFQTTRHRYKLNLLHNTSWTRLDDADIPKNHFDFANFKEIVESNNEGQYVGINSNDKVLLTIVSNIGTVCNFDYFLFGKQML